MYVNNNISTTKSLKQGYTPHTNQGFEQNVPAKFVIFMECNWGDIQNLGWGCGLVPPLPTPLFMAL